MPAIIEGELIIERANSTKPKFMERCMAVEDIPNFNKICASAEKNTATIARAKEFNDPISVTPPVAAF
jgi:hypothetical protein